MTGWIAAAILLALVLITVLWVIRTYNRLVSERLKVDNQWSQIDIVLKQRSDTIPNLVKITAAYAAHEKEVLEEVTQARSRYSTAADPAQAVQAASRLSQAMGRLFALAESYPELKANVSFMDLQEKYHALENKISDFRQFYNDTVMRYNRLILTFPSSLIAGIFHFRERPFFQVGEDDRKTPEIQF